MKHNVIIEYLPPTREELYEFSRQVCKGMNIAETDRETLHGLFKLLEVASRIKAKQMSAPLHKIE